ncbi:STP1 protein [Plasmodium malariae]|uniref:STP1 protein n=1 Tax=Plasmodium malariae TaxID=5858 RepID=A0A1D3PA06_PLAMA|nr:STP1 protein [Plasmodium malariae]SCN12018.1 STP1 protein [Plasmodium malariae]
MNNCFPTNTSIYGTEAWLFRIDIKFKNIQNHIIEKTTFLKNENNKLNFRKTCRDLADYLINEKKDPPPYKTQSKWEFALKYWLQQYYKGLNKYGGCFMILNEEDKKVLDLIYEAEDFCSEKKGKKPNCINTDERNNKKCDSSCLSKIQAYNAWVNNRKMYFKKNEDLINRKCKSINSLLPFPKRSCDVLNDKTLEALPECELSDPSIDHTTVQQNKEQHPDVSHDLTIRQDQDSLKSSLQTQNLSTQQSESAPDHQAEDKKSLSGTPNMKNQADVAESLQTETSSIPKNSDILSSETSTESLSAASDTETVMLPHGQGIIPLFPETLEPVSSTFISPALNKTPGLLKKKKSIKRRQVKLLRVLIPSHSNRKKNFLTHDHPENTIYDEKQIIKKLKIHEHDMIKNIKSSKQKKDRFKTIIEVHMEVLEEFKNEEWEHKKGEFLELCLEVFAEEEYRTYPNLSNGELIMANTRSINDIEKQKILCNKWIKEHRNISEKLKKTVWFNYLKNEWKKEKASIKETEELKMNFSIEIQKISFSEKEKNLWREWISKNRMIIDRYMEQEWDEVLTQELLNMIDECVNEEFKNNISLLNTKELQQKVSYEELYKYIKKKLLAKFCILVFMMVLEECKKEDFIENEGLHLDSYINDCTTEVNLGRKSDVTKEIIEFNGNVLENTENTKIPAYTGEEGLRQEIEEWIKEDDTGANFIYNNSVE